MSTVGPLRLTRAVTDKLLTEHILPALLAARG